jgi:hypothetical protein
MNFRHALGFVCVGVLLARLPQLAPHWLGLQTVDGSSTREIWLRIMSWVQLGIGGGYLAGRVLNALAGLLAFTPPAPEEVVSAAVAPRVVPLRTVRARSVAPQLDRPALPLPTAFDAGLLESQRAA